LSRQPDGVRHARSGFAPATVFVISLLVYVRTLMPGVAFGDWGEAQTIPHVLGIAHPTGYPTYILAAWLFELLPVGSVALRANLLSALLTAAALATLAVILVRLGVRPVLAAAAALMLGAVGTVWAAATVARMDPLHLLLISLLMHRALCWADERRPRDLLVGGVLLGLALGNHLLTLWVAPFLVVFVLWIGRREWRGRPHLLVAAAVAPLLGVAVYAYLPLAAARSPVLPYNHPTTLDGVLWLVGGTQFHGQFQFLSAKGPGLFLASLPGLWTIIAARATPVLPVVGALGLLLLTRARPAFGLTCAAILAAGLYVWATYQQVEQHYLLVPFLMFGLGFGVALEGAARALTWLSVRLARQPEVATVRPAFLLKAVVPAVGLGFALALGTLNWSASDRSGDQSGPTYVADVFAQLPPDAAIVSYWDASTPLWYAHYVEGLRPDVLIVDDTNIAYEDWGTAEARIASLICQRPVFLIRLNPADLGPIKAAYGLTHVTDVRVGALTPAARVTQPLYRVEPPGGSTCSAPRSASPKTEEARPASMQPAR
jgi:hypothetical protein